MAAEAAAKVPGMGTVGKWAPAALIAVFVASVATAGLMPTVAATGTYVAKGVGTIASGAQLGATKLAGLAATPT